MVRATHTQGHLSSAAYRLREVLGLTFPAGHTCEMVTYHSLPHGVVGMRCHEPRESARPGASARKALRENQIPSP